MPPAADAQTLLTPEEQVAQAFTRFKRRLHKTSARWLDAKNGGNRAASVHVSLFYLIYTVYTHYC